MSECYSFVVNGVPCSTEEEKPLLRYLRDELRLLTESRDAEYYAQKVPDTGGV